MLTVAASSGTLTIGDVYNGDTKLTKTTHYTVAPTTGKVTLKIAYLSTLAEGAYTLVIQTSQGDVIAAITINDTTA